MTAELGHSDLLSVCKSSFAQMPISEESMNAFLCSPKGEHIVASVCLSIRHTFVQTISLKVLKIIK